MYENGTMSPADMAAVMNNGNGMGFGGNGAWWWIIILFLFFGNRGWGNGGFNGDGNVYADVQRGFDQNSVMNGINGLNASVGNGFANVQNALCNGFAGVNQGFANAQMANMNQMFDLQTGLGNQLNTIAMNQQNCCCENRAAVADLKYSMATEAAATRAQGQQNTQAVLDKLCQLEMDGIKQNYENRIAGMQNALDQARSDNQALRFAASQGTQTSQILADNAAQTSALEQYLNPAPIPAYVVQNPRFAGQNFGCGCAA